MKTLKKLGNVALRVAEILFTWLVLTFLAEYALSPFWPRFEQRNFREAVAPGNVPYSFPVFVVTPETEGGKPTRHIVFANELSMYKREHSDYSFLIPSELEAQFSNRVKVQPLGKGRQLVELRTSTIHSEVVGWYEATDKDIYPKYYLWSSPLRLRLIAAVLAFCFTGFIFTRFPDRLARSRDEPR